MLNDFESVSYNLIIFQRFINYGRKKFEPGLPLREGKL